MNITDNNIVNTVVNWIKLHPQHCPNYQYTDRKSTHSEIWFSFFANSRSIHDYENSESLSMQQQPLTNGCDYVFNRGPTIGCRCNCPLDFNSARCQFHNALIFSTELHEAIRLQNIVIDSFFAIDA